jgi:hypothetical protein
MQEMTGTNSCARNHDLVSYLYGEAAQDEAKDFEAHARDCAACRTELATFGNVREAVGEWRRQALGSFASTAFEENNRVHAIAPTRRNSAVAALREFFTLSPAWMRAATAMTVIVFFALAAIAVAHFVRQPQTVIVEKVIESGYTEKEVEARIAKALKEQNDSRVKEAPVPVSETVNAADRNPPEERPGIKSGAYGAPQLANNSRKKQQAQPRSRIRPAIETAATDYLPFTASVDDEKLPSLSDLVDDVN